MARFVREQNGRRLYVFDAASNDLLFTNFAGRPDKYHRDGGDRNFNLVLDMDIAEQLREEGWNVRILAPRDPQEDPRNIVKVKVSDTCKIFLVNGNRKTPLDISAYSTLDHARFKKVDMSLNPYVRKDDGGITVYLGDMYATLDNDLLAEMYSSYECPEEEAGAEQPATDMPW